MVAGCQGSPGSPEPFLTPLHKLCKVFAVIVGTILAVSHQFKVPWVLGGCGLRECRDFGLKVQGSCLSAHVGAGFDEVCAQPFPKGPSTQQSYTYPKPEL